LVFIISALLVWWYSLVRVRHLDRWRIRLHLSPHLLLELLIWSDRVAVWCQQLVEWETIVKGWHLKRFVHLLFCLVLMSLIRGWNLPRYLSKLLVFYVLKELGDLRDVELALILQPNLWLGCDQSTHVWGGEPFFCVDELLEVFITARCDSCVTFLWLAIIDQNNWLWHFGLLWGQWLLLSGRQGSIHEAILFKKPRCDIQRL